MKLTWIEKSTAISKAGFLCKMNKPLGRLRTKRGYKLLILPIILIPEREYITSDPTEIQKIMKEY